MIPYIVRQGHQRYTIDVCLDAVSTYIFLSFRAGQFIDSMLLRVIRNLSATLCTSSISTYA